jgi:hypothetical protein
MSGQDDIERLTQLAANAKQAHIRRHAPAVALMLNALSRVGREWDAPLGHRYVTIDGGYRGAYIHPKRAPRQRGGLGIYKMHGNRRGRIVRIVTTLAEAIEFNQNPIW